MNTKKQYAAGSRVKIVPQHYEPSMTENLLKSGA
jgi:hypothetical protein